MGLKRRNKVSAEFNMSSLTDIIFLLLIFFMLTSSIVAPNALNMKLPSSSPTTSSVPPSTVKVEIKRNGTYYVEGTKITSSRLRGRLRYLINQKENPKKVTITVAPDKGTGVEHVVLVLDLARQLKVNTVLASKPD